MKWEGNRQSDQIEDRRGSGLGGKSVGIGTIVVALLVSAVFGLDPGTVINTMSGGAPLSQQTTTQSPGQSPANDRLTQFVATVLADTEDTWSQIFQANGKAYQKPRLVLFSDLTPTACGTGQAAAGPFYCPADQKIYIDLSFFRVMQQRFQVSGEFAQAYVIAHEVGHHVQNIMGVMDKVQEARGQLSSAQSNALSVRVELQADCFAGVWANHANQARQILEAGDIEAALNAASAIGDDALQKQSGGHVVPDSFTHGSSAQRVRWFTRGIESGKLSSCNTFDTRNL